jgi:hypothetical protein
VGMLSERGLATIARFDGPVAVALCKPVALAASKLREATRFPEASGWDPHPDCSGPEPEPDPDPIPIPIFYEGLALTDRHRR